MTRVSLRNIVKNYPNGYEAAKNISLDIEPGEFLVLVGPSGCGKSTLLRMIAGLETISSGDLLFDGERMNDAEPRARDVGMVFQNYALYPHLTVAENIAFPLTIRKENKAVITKRVDEVSKLLGLDSMMARKPKELSGGQRQRVALGRAIVRTPRVFLFDEPLSNLDAQLRVQMRAEISNLQRTIGSTAVYVTHDQVEAMTMGDRIVVLKAGVVQQAASPEEIYHTPANEFVASFMGSPQINFFRGKVLNVDGLRFTENDGGVSFRIPQSIFKSGVPREGAAITLGIRPEHITVSSAESTHTDSFKSEVHATEYVGHETIVYFKTANTLKSARSLEAHNFERGTTLSFEPEAEHFMAFGAEGERL
ncbi:MAG: sn-glycerol-3-phosphate ABC transporter ATP-binding protein UgpC [Bacteroidota bacterium]